VFVIGIPGVDPLTRTVEDAMLALALVALAACGCPGLAACWAVSREATDREALERGMPSGVAEHAETEDSVARAADAYTRATNAMLKGDPGPIISLWSQSDDVTLFSPLGGRFVGWEEVRGAFELAAVTVSDGGITMTNLIVRTDGNLAYAIFSQTGRVCVRKTIEAALDVRATTIFRREDGMWKIVHHHADPMPAVGVA